MYMREYAQFKVIVQEKNKMVDKTTLDMFQLVSSRW